MIIRSRIPDVDVPSVPLTHFVLGRSQRFVSYCETGERRVDAVEFLDFCRAFEKPPSWFLEGWPG